MSASILLHDKLLQQVVAWRATGYQHAHYPTVGELLRWATASEGAFQLRPPQLLALETYWYLRLILGAPHVRDLYSTLFPDEQAWATALALPAKAWQAVGADRARFMHALQTDEHFVKTYRLESVRETMVLPYPSYIFALAMGVGKTFVLGSLIASEFALALAHPDGLFLRNALVFAPGRVIVESLRALIDMPYGALLPPHLHTPFAAAVKFIVPQDGERTIPLLSGSAFNVIITNTEKIRIQKEKIRKGQIGQIVAAEQVELAKAEVANLRLQTIASLPALGIFSDEAHHTYGRALGSDLKKVRKTVDYLAAQTKIAAVVNTTGTPYFGRQPLRDVVLSYGLAAAIQDGLLKEVGDNVVTYGERATVGRKKRGLRGGEKTGQEERGNESRLAQILPDILRDFFATYGDVTLPDGTPAKLAIYFPKTADVAAHRPLIERTLIALGHAPTLLLEHHTRAENKADFDRFRTRQSPHRVALLVDRGVEGWDVPALFACALVRTLKTSNNFVLQAAARCLRQVPSNRMPARIYLSAENQRILTRQLRATYGETLVSVMGATHRAIPVAPSAPAPPQVERRVLPPQPWHAPTDLRLRAPALPRNSLTRTRTTLFGDPAPLKNLPTENAPTTAPAQESATAHFDCYTAAVDLASCYHLTFWPVYRALRQAYATKQGVPVADLPALRRQIEQQCRAHATSIAEATVEAALG